MVDSKPRKFCYVSFEETDETVVDGYGSVTVAEGVANGSTSGSVHSTSGSSGADLKK